MLYVGQIQYINSLPLFGGFLSGEVETEAQFVQATPTRLNRLLREKALDVSLISSVEFIAKQDEYLPLGSIGIAAKERVESVCLYTRLDVQELNKKKIAVTGESATSVKLLQILCKGVWKINPILTPLDETGFKGDAFLLIGDKCLAHPHIEGYQRIDLCEAWYQATQSPFVFALMALRRDIFKEKESALLAFQEQLNTSLNWSVSQMPWIVARAQQQCGLQAKIIEDYFSLINYRLNELDLKGLERFAALCGFPLLKEHFSWILNVR